MTDPLAQREALRSWVQEGTGCTLVHFEGEPEGMGGPAEIWIRRGADRELGGEVRRACEGEDLRETQITHAVVTFSLRCVVRGHEAGCTAYDMLLRLRNRLWLQDSKEHLQRAGLGRVGTTALVDTTRLETVVDHRVLSGAVIDLRFNVAAAEVASLPLQTFRTIEISGEAIAPSEEPTPIELEDQQVEIE